MFKKLFSLFTSSKKRRHKTLKGSKRVNRSSKRRTRRVRKMRGG